MSFYIAAGIGFFCVTLLLAWYITGYGLSLSQQFSAGFKAMLISYLLSAAALISIATLS